MKTTNPISSLVFHNLDRKSAERVRAQYSGFYRYLKGICSLRTVNPGDTFRPPYMEVPEEVMNLATDWRDVAALDCTKLKDTLPQDFFPLIVNPTRPDQDKTEDYYDAFMLLCNLCRRDGAVRAVNHPHSIPKRVILTLPISAVMRKADYLIFNKHCDELVYRDHQKDLPKDLTNP